MGISPPSRSGPASPDQGAGEPARQPGEWLRALLMGVSDAAITADAGGRVSFMNGAAESLTGWRQGDAIGRPLGEVFRLAGEGVLIARDGSERPVEHGASPIRLDGDRETGRVVVFRDAAGGRAEDRLHRSEARVSAMFDSALDCIVSMDHRGVIVEFNASAERTFGVRREDVVGRELAEVIIPPAYRERHRAGMARYMATGEGVVIGRRLELTALRADGSEFPVELTVTRVPGGGPPFFTAYMRDITDRKQAEAALRISEERFRAAVGVVSSLIWTNDPKGQMVGEQPGWSGFTGQTREEYQGYGWSKAVHPDDAQPTIDAWVRAVAARSVFVHEHRVRRFDGEWRLFSIRATPVLDERGEIREWVGVHTDITEQRRAEQERERLLASERAARGEAERAGRLKDEFLATLSHELRTPLNAVMGWASLLRKRPPTAEELEQGLSVIERNARAQAKLIGDLLDMSRIISGKMRLDVQPVDVPAVIEAAMDAVRPAAAAREIRLTSDLEPVFGVVQGDAARLQQVVWNLVSNAVKFTGRGGRVRVGLTMAGAQIEIQVSDTGRGIKAEFLPYVFERFRQADSSSSREHGGLGLGLSIVKQLVELHGGSVSASSAGEGKGSTFIVRLPLAAMDVPWDGESENTRPGASGVEGKPQSLRGVRVLVVDDEPDARELMRRLLESAGAEVIVAESADEGLTAAASQRLDVVLSDIGMAGKDGYAFVRDLRRTGNKVPAAALTAFARSEDRARSIQAGFQVHIAKPVEPVELVSIVAGLARGERSGGGGGGGKR